MRNARIRWIHFLLAAIKILIYAKKTDALAANKNNNPPPTSSSSSSSSSSTPPPDPALVSRRRQLWKLPLGVIGTYGYGRLIYNALSVRDIRFPEAHERRVEAMIQQSLLGAAAAGTGSRTVLRVLEVGIGTDCRLIRRGFYDSAFQQLFNDATTAVELTGVDVQLPTDDVVLAARRRLDRLGSTAGSSTDTKIPRVNLQLQRASITDSLSFPDGYFDAVVCCLTLCSVTDQEAALREIKRLVRPDGGTFGYVEHVAVNKEEPYRFLEAQQTVLDPLQHAVADNCHLHRYTEQAIDAVFGLQPASNSSTLLQHERFLVDNMWPVSCQSCGVIQRIAA